MLLETEKKYRLLELKIQKHMVEKEFRQTGKGAEKLLEIQKQIAFWKKGK